MQEPTLTRIAPGASPPVPRAARVVLFAVWLALAVFLAARHVMWRDEVRAWTLALQGQGYAQMLAGLRGEGHPALWYLMLRTGHDLFASPLVLPVVAGLVGAGAMLLFSLRAPFRLVFLVLTMLSGFALYEYTVMARNYGISMLILFALVALYPRWRDRGGVAGAVLGLLLFALCNTNAHSVILAGGFALFWLCDLWSERGLVAALRRPAFLIGCAGVLLGVAACYWEVSVPLQDAVTPAGLAERSRDLPALARAIVLPGGPLAPLWPPFASGLLRSPAEWVLSLLLWGALGGLVRRPGLFLAGLGVQVGIVGLFQLVYPAGYRHAALLPVFLIALYWLAAQGFGGRWPAPIDARIGARLPAAERAGQAALLALLALQLPYSLTVLRNALDHRPESSAAALGEVLTRHGLGNAIVMGDPDFHLEALPYYAPNPVYLVREERFGRTVHFVRKARLDITLADMLDRARQLRARYRRPVVITLADPVDPSAPPHVWHKGYVWTLRTTPDQVRAFFAATCRLALLDRASGDEAYAVYLLAQDGAKCTGTPAP